MRLELGLQGETEGIRVVHRVQKLSEVSNGAEWNPDPSFSVAEAILDDPAFASVLRAVLSDGHVVVPAAGLGSSSFDSSNSRDT